VSKYNANYSQMNNKKYKEKNIPHTDKINATVITY